MRRNVFAIPPPSTDSDPVESTLTTLPSVFAYRRMVPAVEAPGDATCVNSNAF